MGFIFSRRYSAFNLITDFIVSELSKKNLALIIGNKLLVY